MELNFMGDVIQGIKLEVNEIEHLQENNLDSSIFYITHDYKMIYGPSTTLGWIPEAGKTKIRMVASFCNKHS